MIKPDTIDRIRRVGLDPADFEPTPPDAPTQLDRIEAQTIFTALMTDTLLEEDFTNV